MTFSQFPPNPPIDELDVVWRNVDRWLLWFSNREKVGQALASCTHHRDRLFDLDGLRPVLLDGGVDLLQLLQTLVLLALDLELPDDALGLQNGVPFKKERKCVSFWSTRLSVSRHLLTILEFRNV